MCVSVSPDYFMSMEMRLLKGRQFNEYDNDESLPVAILSKSLATRLWPGGNPIGHRIVFTSKRVRTHSMDIVGVVEDVKQTAITEPSDLQLYVPYRQRVGAILPYMTLVVRCTQEVGGLIAAIRHKVWKVDRTIAFDRISTMSNLVSESLGPMKFNELMLEIFSIIALCLAMTGVYGITSYSASQRTYEIGIRMSLGAYRRDMIWLFVRDSLIYVSIGLFMGICFSLGFGGLLSSLLFGVGSHDPMTISVALTGTGSAALLACLLPAIKASRVDPVNALRYE